MDTKTTSVTKTTGAKPANAASDPAVTAANVPSALKPGKTPKPPGEMFDTNHPKPVPVTTSNNVPNAPSGGGPAGAPGAPPPQMVEADTGKKPGAPGSGGAAAPPPAMVQADGGAVPGPAPPGAPAGAPGVMATPAPAPAGGKVGGLWWEPHLPTQAKPNTLQ
jgi:hypothetical protein